MKCNNISLLFSRLVLVAALAFGQGTTLFAQDYSRMPTEERLSRLERINDSRNDLQVTQTLDALQQDIQTLRGQLEVYERQISVLTKQQQDYYRDLDDRIRKLQAGTAATTATPVGAATTPVTHTAPAQDAVGMTTSAPTITAPAPAMDPSLPLEDRLGPTADNFNQTHLSTGEANDTVTHLTTPNNSTAVTPAPAVMENPTSSTTVVDNQEAYLAAYQLVVNRRFSDAQLALQNYINQYPNGVYVANAYYWLGEVHLTQKQLPEAEQAFKTVVDRFPNNNKTPDALLKLGYTYVAEGNKQLARDTFLQVKSRYSHLAVAQLADAQLAQLGQ